MFFSFFQIILFYFFKLSCLIISFRLFPLFMRPLVAHFIPPNCVSLTLLPFHIIVVCVFSFSLAVTLKVKIPLKSNYSSTLVCQHGDLNKSCGSWCSLGVLLVPWLSRGTLATLTEQRPFYIRFYRLKSSTSKSLLSTDGFSSSIRVFFFFIIILSRVHPCNPSFFSLMILILWILAFCKYS